MQDHKPSDNPIVNRDKFNIDQCPNNDFFILRKCKGDSVGKKNLI